MWSGPRPSSGSATTALRGGQLAQINLVHGDLSSIQLLQRVVGKSPTALRRGKAMMRAAFDMSFEEIWISYLVGATLWLALLQGTGVLLVVLAVFLFAQ